MRKDRYITSKEVEFDYGHRIQNHASKCKNLHGHRAKLVMEVSGPLQLAGSSTGMVIDFGELKTLLMEIHDMLDHGLILESTDPLSCEIRSMLPDQVKAFGFGKVQLVPWTPTAENLAHFCFSYLDERVQSTFRNPEIRVERVVFYETPTSSAIITRNNVQGVDYAVS